MFLSQLNNALDHKISGGDEYGWNCWKNARFLEYTSDHATVSAVFNTKNQVVYEVTIMFNHDADLAYRWHEPMYAEDLATEAKARFIDNDVAWDDLKWTQLETEQDCLEKAKAIFNGVEYDHRIEVPINLSDDEFLQMAKLAHEKDVTINEFVTDILQSEINRVKALNTP